MSNNQAAQAATQGASIEAERAAGYLTPENFLKLAKGEVAEILPVESGHDDGKTPVFFRRTPAAAAGAGDLTASGLTQDEMTRLRRMMRALNIDEKRWDDEQARDAMCTVFGMAAGQLEGIEADRAQRQAPATVTAPAQPAEQTENQCDGCRQGASVNIYGNHVNSSGAPFMACQASRYATTAAPAAQQAAPTEPIGYVEDYDLDRFKREGRPGDYLRLYAQAAPASRAFIPVYSAAPAPGNTEKPTETQKGESA